MHFKHIVVTTDLSEDSKSALELSAYESKMEGSTITLLSVISDWDVPISLHPYIPGPERIEQYRELARTHTLEKLNELVKKYLHNQPAKVEVIVSTQSPAEEICNYAKQHNADLIVMASRGRGAVEDFVLGGTAQKVLRKAHCPVLIIPKKKA